MKSAWLTAAVCLFVVASVRADDKAATDKDKLQGTWKIVSGTHGDQPVPAETFQGMSITYKGDKMMMKMGDMTLNWGFKLDQTKKPKEIDVDMDGKIGKGIYELDGDTMKVAHGEEGDPRPKDFAAKAGSKVSIIVLKREKAAKP